MEKCWEFESHSAMISLLITTYIFLRTLWNGTPDIDSHLYALLTLTLLDFWDFPEISNWRQGHCCLNIIQTNKSGQKMKSLLTFKLHFHFPQKYFLLLWLTVSAARPDIDSLPINIKILFFDLLGEAEGTKLFYFISSISFPQASPDWSIGSCWVSGL